MNLRLISVCFFAVQAMGFAHQNISEISGECVVLIHGLGRTSLSMKRLEWNLAHAGYETINVSYPSQKFGIEQLANDCLQKALDEKVPPSASKIHFVTHSMGGIILRQYLSNHTLRNLGAVVMLAPPNQGSELADVFKQNALGRWILGPAGCELGTAPTDLPKRLGSVEFDLGVIAGDRSLNPWFSQILTGPNDGKVSVASTKIDGMKQFRLVHNSHTWMMWRNKTIQRVMYYLRHNQFDSTAGLNHG